MDNKPVYRLSLWMIPAALVSMVLWVIIIYGLSKLINWVW